MARAIRRRIYREEASRLTGMSETELEADTGYTGPLRRSNQYGIRYWFEDDINEWKKRKRK